MKKANVKKSDQSTDGLMAVRVVCGTVLHGGVIYGVNEQLQVNAEQAKALIFNGYVETAEPAKVGTDNAEPADAEEDTGDQETAESGEEGRNEEGPETGLPEE